LAWDSMRFGQEFRVRTRVAVRFLFENSMFLIAGAIAGLIWANVDHAGYALFTHGELGADGELHGPGHLFHFIINDVAMAFFFAIAAKEVWEALLPGGDLSSWKTAGTPLIATAGGMLGPAALYVGGALILGQHTLLKGWAVPMATDIAFSYLLARLIFGPRHPAIPFLLLLAIADDAGGLIVLAVFYPTGEMHLGLFFGLVTLAVVSALLMRQKLRLRSFWWYMIPGAVSWTGFHFGGIHPALGLVPIIPCMPHAKTDLGVFAVEEQARTDTLNRFEQWWQRPVELILGLFGLVNAGVALSSFGAGTALVTLGLLVGKPLGITLFVLVIAKRFLKLELPRGMDTRDLVVVGITAGIGFTVALFVSTVAFAHGSKHLDPVKMGALLSFAAAIFAVIAARLLGIKPLTEAGAPPPAEARGEHPADAEVPGQEVSDAAAEDIVIRT